MTLRIYANLDALPSDVVALFDAAAAADPFCSLTWFKILAETALPQGDAPRVAVLEQDGAPLAALALTRRATAEQFAGAREYASLANFYSCAFGPVIAAGTDPHDAARQLGASLAAALRPIDLFDLHTLTADAPATAGLEQGLRDSGLLTRRYFHFGNWYERVDSGDFTGYMARRPPALRNTIARKQRKLTRDKRLSFEILSDAESLGAGAAAYADIYAASWKSPEPYPAFLPRLIADMGAAGRLRLGLARVDAKPAAAQIWLIAGTQATIFKLAHDERLAELSAGSILTAHMMQHAIEREGVREIDFGRGDDSYKQSWLALRRERCGVIACNPKTWRGAAAALRHVLLPALRSRFRRHAAGPA
jgi:CelD/BcsL family acetyltransferase involved in cellulose biosynthesis